MNRLDEWTYGHTMLFFVTHYLRNLEQDEVAILMLIKTMHKRMFYMKRNHLKLIL